MADVHQHEDRSTYYLDQLFTIGVCGAIAAVTILLWQSKLLGKMLHPKFHIWVAVGGVSLLVLVFIRAVAVWRSVDEAPAPCEAPTHGHAHGEGCDHSHGHSHSHSGEERVLPVPTGGGMSLAITPPAGHSHAHGHSHSHSHSHGHDHDHGWAPWRYVVLLLPVALYFLVLYNPAYDKEPVSDPTSPLDHILNFLVIFRSILWEAMPFIVLGAIIAGILEEFLPQRVLVALVPRNPFVAVCVGGLLGLLFPMCECGIIPIMRRLLRKGLPLSSCIAYLLAGPIVNVVVLLSTIAAFSGMENVYEGNQPSYQMGSFYMTLFRAGLGYLVAVVTAMVVHLQHKKHGNSLLTPLARPGNQPVAEENEIARRPIWQRVSNVTETALHDFVDITVFLILGALLAASVRLFVTNDQVAEFGRNNAPLAIALMMGLAIVLCLCSEADAFVAASFVTLRPSAKLAFLVLGPMLDIKLYAMYTRIFRPRLILTIYVCVISQVFLYTMAVHYFWETYAEPWKLVEPKLVTTPTLSEKEMQEILSRSLTGIGLLNTPTPGGAPWASLAGGAGVMLVNPTLDVQDVSFLELENATRTPEMRNYFTGRRVRLTGRFVGNEQAFQLQRYKINCCAADATPLDAVIILDPSSKETIPAARLRNKWVQVIGRAAFFERSPGVWKVAILISPSQREPLGDLVKEVPVDPNPYIY